MEISDLFKLTFERGASDLLLTAGTPPLIRLHGELIPTEYPTLTPDMVKRLIY